MASDASPEREAAWTLAMTAIGDTISRLMDADDAAVGPEVGPAAWLNIIALAVAHNAGLVCATQAKMLKLPPESREAMVAVLKDTVARGAAQMAPRRFSYDFAKLLEGTPDEG